MKRHQIHLATIAAASMLAAACGTTDDVGRTGAYTGPGPAGGATATTPQQGGAPVADPNRTRAAEQRARAEDRQERAVDRHRMTELIGADVRNRQGEKIGDIEEVIIDAQGEPALAIVSTGGFLGLGERRHAVPYKALERAPSGTDRVLDMTKDQLRQAPNFEPSERPYDKPGWMSENQRAYGNR